MLFHETPSFNQLMGVLLTISGRWDMLHNLQEQKFHWNSNLVVSPILFLLFAHIALHNCKVRNEYRCLYIKLLKEPLRMSKKSCSAY